MALAPGTRLGAYEILTLIGSGGMGEVYRAHDNRLNRDVAIKVLPGDLAADHERLAVEQLRYHVRGAIKRADVEHREDVRVVQRGRCTRFLLEPTQAVAICRNVRWQHLDGYVAVQAAIPRPIHLAHAAAANERDDFVSAEASAGSESQPGL